MQPVRMHTTRRKQSHVREQRINTHNLFMVLPMHPALFILLPMLVSVLASVIAACIFGRTVVYTIRYLNAWKMRRYIMIRLMLVLFLLAYSVFAGQVMIRTWVPSLLG